MVMVFLDLQVEKQMAIETFVRILLGIASYELRGRVDLSSCTYDLEGVRQMVKRLDQEGYRLALMLDEFDVVTTNPNFDLEFFSSLRFLANHYNVAYLTSSARNLQELCHTKEISDSPFFNIFSTMRLSAFTPEEAAEMIRVPSARVGRPLEPHTNDIVAMAGLFPFFLQMACSHTMEYLEEHPDRAPDFAEIRRRFYEEARLHYRYIWDGFDEHERSAVLRLAAGKSIPDSLRHVIEELSQRQYVERTPSSRLFSATFQQFVASEGRSEGGRSFLSKLFGRGETAASEGRGVTARERGGE
jgi:serine/threonine-protein kinase